ncbi:MAG: BatD family protein, partial [Muribaculaceae bacterium]|nr:BatD family protein [Muribaculaceae bacterium]
FIYSADKAGTVTVPAVTVNAGGHSLSSRSVTFKVLPPDRNAAAGAAAGQGSNPREQVQQADASQRISPDDLLIRISFNKPHVYEQEAVIATIKVYTTTDITSIMPKKQPVFEGFLSEELPVTLEPETEHYNGRNYTTAVLKRCLLYPQKSGRLTVNSGQYDVVVRTYETVNMGYFMTRRPVQQTVTTNSNQATLNVEALPEPRPEGFNGAVGSFSVSTELSPEVLRTNEAATYSYIVKGTGNIKYLTAPTIEFPAGFDRYTPKTDIDARVSGADMTGTYRIDYTVVPQEPGKFTIPGGKFVYFDPSSRKYETIDTRSYDVNVARGSATSVAAVEQRAIDNTITDIRHIHTSPEVPVVDRGRLFHSLWYWLAYVLVVVALVAVVLSYRRTLRLRADVSGRRLARANRVALKRLRAARGFMQAGKQDEFYQELARALWG